MTIRDVTVSELEPGQQVSMPECNVPLSYVHAISSPFMGMRIIELADPDTGEVRSAQMWLGLQRTLRLHDDVVEHHTYTNISSTVKTVALGKWHHTLQPGEALRYTGRAQPALFETQVWLHQVEDIVFASAASPGS